MACKRPVLPLKTTTSLRAQLIRVFARTGRPSKQASRLVLDRSGNRNFSAGYPQSQHPFAASIPITMHETYAVVLQGRRRVSKYDEKKSIVSSRPTLFSYIDFSFISCQIFLYREGGNHDLERDLSSDCISFCELIATTPLREAVTADFNPAEERIRVQHYPTDVAIGRLSARTLDRAPRVGSSEIETICVIPILSIGWTISARLHHSPLRFFHLLILNAVIHLRRLEFVSADGARASRAVSGARVTALIGGDVVTRLVDAVAVGYRADRAAPGQQRDSRSRTAMV